MPDAIVQTLSAEVHVLKIENRQVTLSLAKQLDVVFPSLITPWGRINLGNKPSRTDVVGEYDGRLVRSFAVGPSFDLDIAEIYRMKNGEMIVDEVRRGDIDNQTFDRLQLESAWVAVQFANLPLLLLAGLK